MMKKILFLSLVFVILILGSCKTDYEKVRASGDAELMAKTADAYYEEEDYLKAQSLYEIIIPYYRGKEEAADIFFKFAYTHYYLSEYILANHYFKNFSNTYFNSEKREEAMYMAAFSNYELSPNMKLDQSYSEKAIQDFQLFINTFPNSERVDQANSLIVEMRGKAEEKSFHQGQLYLDIKQYEAAMVSFENMVQEFPDSELVEEARFKSIIASYDLAKNSIYGKQKERFDATLVKIEKFKKKFPKSKYRKELNVLKKNSNNKINEL